MKRVFNLGSGWIFAETNVIVPTEKINMGERVNLPHVSDFSSRPFFSCIYQKEIPVPTELRNREMWLEFDGVCGDASVFVGDEICCDHKGSFTRFRCNITPFIECDTVALVSVVVRQSSCGNRNEFFSAGIYGSVRLIIAENSRFSLCDNGSDGVYVDTAVWENTGLLSIFSVVDNPINYDILTYEVFDAGGNSVSLSKTHPKSSKVNITIPDVYVWDTESSYLYTVEAKLIRDGKLLDCVKVRFGFRNITAGDCTFELNGKPLALKGFSVDRERKDTGYISDNSRDYSDICSVKELYANFLCQNQLHSRDFNSYCDESGIISCVKCGISVTAEMTEAETETAKSVILETVSQTYNNPGIIMLCLGSIVPASDGTLPVEKANELYETAASVDKKRFLYFEGETGEEIKTDLYAVTKEGTFDFVDDISAKIDRFSGKNKPVVLCFGVPSDNSFSAKPEKGDYSESYRCEYFEKIFDMLPGKKCVAAVAAGTLREYDETEAEKGSFGIVDKAGLKSDAAYLCKLMYGAKGFSHICGIDFSVKDPPVRIYSASKELTVILNEKENKPYAYSSENGVFIVTGLRINRKTKIDIR